MSIDYSTTKHRIDFSGVHSKVARKIYQDLTALHKEIEKLRERGERIVFGNGCFDLLHSGHLNYLYSAKDYGDVLIIAVNTDESMRKIGKTPSKNQRERMSLVAAIEAVDYVVPLWEETPTELIELIRPDVHTKGSDYTPDMLPELEAVRRYGGRVEFVGGPKISSSRKIRERIKES